MRNPKTENCIICGKKASIWRGHVLARERMALGNYVVQNVAAGFCEKHVNTCRSDESGCFGNYDPDLMGKCVPMFQQAGTSTSNSIKQVSVFNDDAKSTEARQLTKAEKDRLAVIKAMHTLVLCMNDEGAYLEWINLVPDCPTEQDFLSFAENDDDGSSENELFTLAVNLFKRLWEHYVTMTSGLYIGDKVY